MPFEISKGVLTACNRKKKITEITIPEGVTEIKPSVFREYEFESVTLPSTLRSIGGMAFMECKKLRHITFPESLLSIGQLAFYFCDSLQSVTFPENLSAIGVKAFNSSGVKDVTLPRHIGMIGEGAFTLGSVLRFPLPEGECAIRLEDYWGDNKEEQLLLQFLYTDSTAFREKLFATLKSGSYKLSLSVWQHRLHPEAEPYRSYLKRNISKAVRICINREDAAELTALLGTGFVTKQNIDKLIEFAILHGASECQVLLMDYKNQTLGFSKPENRFRL